MTAAELAEQNVPLARALAWKYIRRTPGCDPADIESDALLGLMQAAMRFDPSCGVPFGAYATTRIFGAISDGQRDRDPGSRSDRIKVRRIGRERYRFAARHNRWPTRTELATVVGMPLGDMDEITIRWSLSRRDGMLNLDSTYEGIDHPLMVAEVVPDERVDLEADVLSRETRTVIAEYLPRLDEREHMVIAMYYWDEMTLAEIGEVLGVTESRVSQIMTKARERLAVLMRGERSDLLAA